MVHDTKLGTGDKSIHNRRNLSLTKPNKISTRLELVLSLAVVRHKSWTCMAHAHDA